MDNIKTTESKSTNGLKIVVIGVGSGGNNIIEELLETPIADKVKLVSIDANPHMLDQSKIPNKLQIGKESTHNGAICMKPKNGREAALESYDDIRDMILSV